MVTKTITFAEHLFWTAVWVILALILAGVLMHFLSAKGILPGVWAWIGTKTNLQAQSGGQ